MLASFITLYIVYRISFSVASRRCEYYLFFVMVLSMIAMDVAGHKFPVLIVSYKSPALIAHSLAEI